MKEENVFEALLRPNIVFIANETSFKICPEKSGVMAEKGTKYVHEIDRAHSNFS